MAHSRFRIQVWNGSRGRFLLYDLVIMPVCTYLLAAKTLFGGVDLIMIPYLGETEFLNILSLCRILSTHYVKPIID